MEKPKINYPCVWYYKIIGYNRELITKLLPIICKKHDYTFGESHQSKTGKYISFNFSTRVKSEEERNKVFNILKNIPSVKIVL
jgi:hypothetical protein